MISRVQIEIYIQTYILLMLNTAVRVEINCEWNTKL